MAVTQGHGNPKWSRDETILALDLYFASGDQMPSPKSPSVIALSELLRSLPYHEDAARKTSFRNPDGVAFKLQNLRQVATGKGLGNVSAMDRNIWAEFGDARETVSRLARAIRDGVKIEATLPETPEEEFSEGRLLTVLHYRRERDPKLRLKLLAIRNADQGLACDACRMSRPDLPPELQEALFEAHHLLPLASGERTTKIGDLALLCACCHRIVHKLMTRDKGGVTLTELSGIVSQPRPFATSSTL